MGARNYRDLIVWQKAMDFVEVVYRLTSTFPAEEKFGLTSQLRRAAVSIASNVAEGQGRLSSADFRRFVLMANGSLRETETQLLIAARLGYTAQTDVDQAFELTGEIGRLLFGLARRLRDNKE